MAEDPGVAASPFQDLYARAASLRAQSRATRVRLHAAVAWAESERQRAEAERVEVERIRQRRLQCSAYARLQAQLETMPVIEQAKGIIMARQPCGPDEAFDLLRRASQRANIQVRVLAVQIVASTSGGPAKPGNNRGQAAPAATARQAAPARHGQAS